MPAEAPKQDTTDTEAVVALEIPATSRHLALARTAAVGVIAELDPDLDAVENLRLAVSELVSLVSDATTAAVVRIEFRLDPPTLTVSAVPIEPGQRVVPDDLARRILDTTTESHEFFEDGSGELRVDVLGPTDSE
ncbi:MAG: hypothetical protein R2716_12150 [Microthrixaceae bacterium]